MSESATLGVLLDHTQDKIALLDDEGRFTYVNEAVRRILGYEPSSMVGEDAFDYIHPDEVEAVRTDFERTLDREAFEVTTAEYRFRAADGSWVWIESRLSNLTDDELDGYVVSSRDVSDRVAAERDWAETATQLSELSATTGDVLWMFDGDWSEVLFVNPAYEDVYGGDRAELETDAASFLDTIHPDDVPRVEAAMERASSGESIDVEYRVNPGEDYGVWVWVQAHPIVEDGEVVRITGFTRDITDRRRRERQLYVMDNLLRHNLRNDMSIIMGNATLIEESFPEADTWTTVIRQTGEDLLATAEKEREVIDLLTSEVCTGDIDLARALDGAVETVGERFPDADLEAACPDDVAVRAVDELHVALVELLENGVRHSESDRPWTRIEAHRDGEDVVVTVRDDGPPVPDIESQVLSGNSEVTDLYHSSGLGLWLVYWVVELSDGRIKVSTDGDPGNRIELRLPSA